jgi:serine/threonine protein kinase
VHIKIAFDEPDYQLPKETSENLRAVINLMLQKEPEKRPTAKQLMDTAPFSYMAASKSD